MLLNLTWLLKASNSSCVFTIAHAASLLSVTNMLGPYRLHVNTVYVHFSDNLMAQVSNCQLSGKSPQSVCR